MVISTDDVEIELEIAGVVLVIDGVSDPVEPSVDELTIGVLEIDTVVGELETGAVVTEEMLSEMVEETGDVARVLVVVGGSTTLTFLAIERLKGYKSGCLLSAKHVIDVIWSNKLLVLS